MLLFLFLGNRSEDHLCVYILSAVQNLDEFLVVVGLSDLNHLSVNRLFEVLDSKLSDLPLEVILVIVKAFHKIVLKTLLRAKSVGH